MSRNVHGRALVLVVLSCAPLSAAAQESDQPGALAEAPPAPPEGEPPDEGAFAEAAASMETEREGAFEDAQVYLDPSHTEWVLDDGVGVEEVPWDDVDRETSYLPLGLTHFGVQVRLAALPGGSPPQLDGPLIDAGAFFDVRYGRWSAWHFRVGVALSYQPHSEQYLGAGRVVASSPLALRLRLSPIAFDIGRWVAVRAGGDLGLQWTPRIEGGMSTDFFGAATGEIVGSFLDGQLEVGVIGGIQFTSIYTTMRSYPYSSLSAEAVLGLTAAYVVP